MTERTVPRLKFNKDFDFKPTSQSTVAYKAGWEGPVTQACAEAALKAEVAELVTAPKSAKVDG